MDFGEDSGTGGSKVGNDVEVAGYVRGAVATGALHFVSVSEVGTGLEHEPGPAHGWHLRPTMSSENLLFKFGTTTPEKDELALPTLANWTQNRHRVAFNASVSSSMTGTGHGYVSFVLRMNEESYLVLRHRHIVSGKRNILCAF